jgi:LysR family hydrogen peroxide-inducible transcriptional activator
MLHLPTVKQLRYFVALEQHGRFGRAAEACLVSQSAFSVAIRELEALLNVQLVDRTNHRVTITPIGRRIATQARLCLQGLERLVDMAGHEKEPLSGPLTLGLIPTVAPFLLPEILPTVRQRYTALKLFIREGKTDVLYDELLEGKLDLIVLAFPYELPQVQIMPLFQDRFFLAYREGTQLIDPECFSINQATAESMLLLEDGHCMRDHALAACQLRNQEVVNRFAASSLFTLLEMVDSDLGFTFVPEMAVGSLILSQTRIKLQPLVGDNYREIVLAWRKGTARSEEFRTLGNLVQKAWEGRVANGFRV